MTMSPFSQWRHRVERDFVSIVAFLHCGLVLTLAYQSGLHSHESTKGDRNICDMQYPIIRRALKET